jgi:hypothetical protein
LRSLRSFAATTDAVLTGSFKFTKVANGKSAENPLIIQNAAPATQYDTKWTAHARHGTPYKRKAK